MQFGQQLALPGSYCKRAQLEALTSAVMRLTTEACNVKATSPKVALLLEAPFLDDSYSCSTFKHMLE